MKTSLNIPKAVKIFNILKVLLLPTAGWSWWKTASFGNSEILKYLISDKASW
ncbi:MAG: hypothetical protein ABI760_11365 [Ferruginibacter sp.]